MLPLQPVFIPYQIPAANVMEKHVLGPNNDAQLNEEVWQGWMRKNEAKDRIRLARRKKLLAIVLVLGIAAIVVYRIAG